MAMRQHFICAYLTQSFYSTPKVIRQRCAYLALLAMTDKRKLSLVVSTLSIHIELPVIKQVIANATREPMNVCVIDIHHPEINRKFRSNSDDFYVLLDMENDLLESIE